MSSNRGRMISAHERHACHACVYTLFNDWTSIPDLSAVIPYCCSPVSIGGTWCKLMCVMCFPLPSKGILPKGHPSKGGPNDQQSNQRTLRRRAIGRQRYSSHPSPPPSNPLSSSAHTLTTSNRHSNKQTTAATYNTVPPTVDGYRPSDRECSAHRHLHHFCLLYCKSASPPRASLPQERLSPS